MTHVAKARWEKIHNDETRRIEELLRTAFQQVDAYRYNSASIRVRIVDPKFAGKSDGQRDDLVEPWLSKLPPETQGDIMSLLTFAPGETEQSMKAGVANLEFEDPTPSML